LAHATPAPDVIRDAAALWRALARQAGLDAKRYDGPLVQELAERLGVSVARFEAEPVWPVATPRTPFGGRSVPQTAIRWTFKQFRASV